MAAVSGAPAVFAEYPAVAALLGFRTWLAQVGWPTPAVDVFCGVGGVLVHLLVFYLVQALLPLSGFLAPHPSAASPTRVQQPFRLQFAGLLLRWCLVVGCVTWFSTVCCALPQGPAACAAFPAAGSLGVFGSLGVGPSPFSGVGGGLVTGLWPLLRLLGFGFF